MGHSFLVQKDVRSVTPRTQNILLYQRFMSDRKQQQLGLEIPLRGLFNVREGLRSAEFRFKTSIQKVKKCPLII